MDFRFVNHVLRGSFDKASVFFADHIMIDDYDIHFPGEYEKSGILAEVREFEEHRISRFTMGDTTILYIPSTVSVESPDIIQFAGDIDVLILPGVKELQKLVESIDARVVIPYGPSKSSFFGMFGQNVSLEEVRVLKSTDFEDERTIFVNLAE